MPVTVTTRHVSLGLGDDVTCTINNNDNAPALHLRKTVTNDNGGTALATGGRRRQTGRGQPDHPVRHHPGRHRCVAEGRHVRAVGVATAPPATRPATGAASSTGSDPAVPVTVTAGSVQIGLGDDVTCTINNNDNAPALHLRKTVTNDNGGTAMAPTWTLKADGRGQTRPTCRARPRSTAARRSRPTRTPCPRRTAPPATRPATGAASSPAPTRRPVTVTAGSVQIGSVTTSPARSTTTTTLRRCTCARR